MWATAYPSSSSALQSHHSFFIWRVACWSFERVSCSCSVVCLMLTPDRNYWQQALTLFISFFICMSSWSNQSACRRFGSPRTSYAAVHNTADFTPSFVYIQVFCTGWCGQTPCFLVQLPFVVVGSHWVCIMVVLCVFGEPGLFAGYILPLPYGGLSHKRHLASCLWISHP